MTALIGALEDKTDAEIAVVTIASIEPYATINEYAIELASQWGIGKKGDDTGILFLLAMKERQVRIDVGYGFNSKAERLKWLSVFNSHRNNWAHAGTKEKGLNREEVNFLQVVYDHLL